MGKDNFLYGHNSRVVLDLIASKWTLLVLHALQNEVRRYGELNKMVDGVTQKVLTETLRKLERDGIVERLVYPIFPPKVEYKLTSLGLELLKVTEAMAKWAEDHFEEVEHARYEYDARPQAELR